MPTFNSTAIFTTNTGVHVWSAYSLA